MFGSFPFLGVETPRSLALLERTLFSPRGRDSQESRAAGGSFPSLGAETPRSLALSGKVNMVKASQILRFWEGPAAEVEALKWVPVRDPP